MAQSGVDDRAGSGASEQRATLAAGPAYGRVGGCFGFAGRAGRGGGVAATLVSGLLSFFHEVGIWPQPAGWIRGAGAPFFHRHHAAGADSADAGPRPVASAPPVRRSELLVGSATQIVIRPALLVAKLHRTKMRVEGKRKVCYFLFNDPISHFTKDI